MPETLREPCLSSQRTLGSSLGRDEAPPSSEVAETLGWSCVTLDGSPLGVRAHRWGWNPGQSCLQSFVTEPLPQAGKITEQRSVNAELPPLLNQASCSACLLPQWRWCLLDRWSPLSLPEFSQDSECSLLYARVLDTARCAQCKPTNSLTSTRDDKVSKQYTGL